MNLYHKYRPKTLEEVKGNEEIVSSLSGLLNTPQKMPHVYLFHGESGCGKTTLGRVIKNHLQVSDNDYQEINSSEMRGIDTIRDIIRNAQYKPVESKYRIYLIDECHKLTNDAQNAFLKILEDTPAHVLFILCTTDEQKLIKAIKSRCLIYQVKPLTEVQMKGLIRKISKQEGVSLANEVLDVIVSDSFGHPRAALQILEQVLSTEEDKRLEVAKQTALTTSQSIELCRALMSSNDWSKIKVILQGLQGQDAEGIRRQVMGYAQAVLLKTDNIKAGLVLESFIEPNFTNGFPQLVLSCYTVVKG